MFQTYSSYQRAAKCNFKSENGQSLLVHADKLSKQACFRYELAHLNFNGTFQATEISTAYDVITLWSFLFFILWAWRRATELNFIAGNNAVWILRWPPHHYIGEHPHISWCTRYCLMNACVCVWGGGGVSVKCMERWKEWCVHVSVRGGGQGGKCEIHGTLKLIAMGL